MHPLLVAGASLLVVYVLLLAALAVARPRELRGGEALRLLPDVVRLVRRLATDRAVPPAPRAGLWLLLGYLALPLDLVPDVIPVIGWADDVIVVVLCLRWVIRAAGREVVRRSWPGSPDGLRALGLLVGRRLVDGPAT